MSEFEEIEKWLVFLESSYDSTAVDISNSGELFQLKGKFHNLKEEIDKKSPQYRSLYNEGT